MEYLYGILGLISLDRILALDPLLRYSGLAIVLLFLLRFLFSVLRFRLIKAFTSLVYAIAIAIILSQAGHAIQQLIAPSDEPPSGRQALDSRGQPLPEPGGILRV